MPTRSDSRSQGSQALLRSLVSGLLFYKAYSQIESDLGGPGTNLVAC
jgi:hypothetical protein